MSDRRLAIELKRAKVLALRQETQRRREAHEKKDITESVERLADAVTKGIQSVTRKDLDDVDTMLSSLGIAAGCDALVTEGNSLPVQPQDNSVHQSVGQSRHCPTASGTQTTNDVVGRPAKQKKVVLSVQVQSATNFPPHEQITYCKHTQTCNEIPAEYEALDSLSPRSSPEEVVGSMLTSCDEPFKTGHGLLKNKTGASQAENEQQTCNKPIETNSEDVGKPAKHQLTEEEQAKILASVEFQSFFERSAMLVERALGEKANIFKDYTQIPTVANHGGEGQLLTLNRSFSGKGLERSVVSSLDWSMLHPELLLSSYSMDRGTALKEEGLCLIWNMMYGRETPEHTLKCSTEVVASKFAVFHPNLVLGGTYSGQIVLWDIRERNRLPVLQSMLWLNSHTQPVFSLNLIGGKNSHNLVSTSSDSKVCVWTLDMLTKPQQIIDLSTTGGVSVAPTCVDFPSEETNNFVIGAEEGSIYYASLSGEFPGITHHFSGWSVVERA